MIRRIFRGNCVILCNLTITGRWGDYRDCDMPFETIHNAFKTMKQLHGDADHIYFAGDIIDVMY